MGLVRNFEGLVAMRVLLGLFEAGLFPGMLSTKETLCGANIHRLRLFDLHVLQAL